MTFGISIFTAIESVADDTVTVDKQLLSFSGCDTGTAFALRFHKNSLYASELYAFTTVASLVTIPLFVFAAERLIL